MNTTSVFTNMTRYGFLLCVLCALAGMPGTAWAAETKSRAKTPSSKTVSAANREKALARIAAMEWQNPAAFTPSIDVGEKSLGDAANGVNLESLKKPVAAPPQNKSSFSWNLAIGEELTNRDRDFDSGQRYEDFVRRKEKEQNPAGIPLPFKAEEVFPAEVIFGMRVAF